MGLLNLFTRDTNVSIVNYLIDVVQSSVYNSVYCIVLVLGLNANRFQKYYRIHFVLIPVVSNLLSVTVNR